MKNLTAKQVEILTVIVKCNTDGSFLDLDQLRDKLSYSPQKAAMQFSVRYMIAHGLIEKKPREVRRGASRRILAATSVGYAEYRELRKT